jgi:hypothetical protein
MTTLLEVLRYELGAAGEEAADRIEELEQQLAEREKQIVLMRDALEYAWKPSYETNGITGARMANEALAATQDLSGLVLCDAEPVGYIKEGYYRSAKWNEDGPLYKARKL